LLLADAKAATIAEKIKRKALKLKRVEDLNDLVGIRFILLFARDIDEACRLIEATFTVLERQDAQLRLAEDQFGYASIHFAVELPASWLRVPSGAGLGGLSAEIQVRTTAQHIWAAALTSCSTSMRNQTQSTVRVPQRVVRYRSP
jgi:putative GTP pyrophosphokinase